MQTQGLGLYSVAVQIGSIGGQYGYKPRVEMTTTTTTTEIPENNNGEEENNNGEKTSMQGSIFWFRVPLLDDLVGSGSSDEDD